MTGEQIDQQMVDFIDVVERELQKLEPENIELLTILGYLQIHEDLMDKIYNRNQPNQVSSDDLPF